ncbi:MAG: PEP-CTERM sorting domain-containing protein [Armatimonadetes bacterium]|nr:PEP-CTERM sorting domain-containing protein [Armatimonadota bacterium]
MNRNTLIFLVAVMATSANAQLAYDNAADAVYTGGNINGLNGGYGFNAWVANPPSNTGTAGNFQFTSSQNGNGSSGNIDSSGKSFGLYSNSNDFSQIFRSFNVSMVGARTISMDWDNGYIDQGMRAYAQIGSYQFGFIGGQANYYYDIGAGQVDSGLPFTTDGLHLKLVLNGTGGFHFSASPYSSSSVWAAASLSGANVPVLIGATSINTGNGSSNNSYLNNMKITGVVPEPGSLLVLGLGFVALSRRIRK